MPQGSKIFDMILKYLVLPSLLFFSNILSAQNLYNDSLKSVQYNIRALDLTNDSKYDEAVELLNQALQAKENAVSYYLLGRIYNIEEKWDQAIRVDEKALELDPKFIGVYPDLFNAYYGAEKWDKVIGVSEKAQNAVPGAPPLDAQIEIAESALEAQNISPFIVFLFFLALVVSFSFPIYKSYKSGGQILVHPDIRFSELVLLSAAVSCIFWFSFFAVAKWIRSFNPHIAPEEFVNYIRGSIFEQDGIESFTLYCIMFANLLLSLISIPFIVRIKTNDRLYFTSFAVLAIIAGYYFFSIGFSPPLSAIGNIILPVFVVAGTIGLYLLYLKNSMLAKVAAVILACYTGLISLGPSSSTDLAFIISPALRLMHGAKIPDIYFQYDLFLSFLAIAWFKINMTVETFPYIGQVSFFLFFIGAFFFSDRFFKSKGLSVVFLVALILVRFYTVWADVPSIFQVTPIRLDLWLILLLVANKKGVHHWLVGLCIGLLVLFHRNLGLIYLGAYGELLILLFIADVVTTMRGKEGERKSVITLVVKHLKLNAISLSLILASIALCFILFNEMFSASALVYRKLGVGMLPVSRISFYWYMPVVFSCAFVFLLYYKNRLSERYVSVGLFIILLAIGNSMYFFGRSHENNILNITGLLVLSLFLLFDILIFLSPEPTEPVVLKEKNKKPDTQKSTFGLRKIYTALPFLFIFLVCFYYSDRVNSKLQIQADNIKEGRFIYPFTFNPPIDTAAIRYVTANNDKVYFMDFWEDCYQYYYGNYAPVGYYSPCQAWVYKKDLVLFLQDLLDKGYHIIYKTYQYQRYVDCFSLLNYNHSKQQNNMVAISKQEVKCLLPVTYTSAFHLAIKDSVAKNGLDFNRLKLNDEFTVETIFKSTGLQKNGMIVSNQVNFQGFRGFTLQTNGSNPDEYIFCFSNGTSSLPNVLFRLEGNKWHYLAVTVNKAFISIYDNGKLIGKINSGGLPIVNSSMPLTVGNRSNRDADFKGYIREVKISNGNINEAEILSNAEKINSVLANGLN